MASAAGLASSVSQMHCERLLSGIKAATPSKLPYAERLCGAGLLSMFMRPHIAAGGRDPRVTRREDLLAAGVPLKCAKPKSKSARGGLQASIAFATVELQKEQQLQKMTKAQCDAFKRHCCRVKWPVLPPETQEMFVRIAERNRDKRPVVEIDRPSVYDGSRRFNICDENAPLLTERLEQEIRRVSGPETLGGLSRPLGVLRQEFTECIVCNDAGDPFKLYLDP